MATQLPLIDLRLGRWEEALDGESCDLLLSDPPFSERTHSGHDASVGGTRRGIGFASWSEEDARRFVESWAPRTRGWFVVETDHVLAPVFEAALAEAGRYVFAPLPYVAPGSRVRLQGDGPACWTTWIVVARPRTKEFAKWGALPGAYVGSRGNLPLAGGKPEWLQRQIVRDYSRRGEVVCDPCAGGGSTLRAAVLEGRLALGAEVDPDTYTIASGDLAKLRGPAGQLALFA